ncbi:MAG: hypothetical protein WBF53_09285, partial [Litorimonas sp.]
VPAPAWFQTRGLIALAVGAGLIALVLSGAAERQLSVFATLVLGLGLLLVLNAVRLKAQRSPGMIGSLMDDLATMPTLMKRLALVQFTSWFAFFTLWVYLNSAVTSHHFGTTDPTSEAFGAGSLAVNDIFAVYSLVAWGFSLLIPLFINKLRESFITTAIWITVGSIIFVGLFYLITSDVRLVYIGLAMAILCVATLKIGIGLKPFYALSLLVGGLSFIAIRYLDPSQFAIAATGIGVVWACVLTLPYALLADALPAERMGTYMGIFNYFIVIPQLVVGTIMGTVLTTLLGGATILTLVVAGGVMMSGALLLVFVPYEKPV